MQTLTATLTEDSVSIVRGSSRLRVKIGKARIEPSGKRRYALKILRTKAGSVYWRDLSEADARALVSLGIEQGEKSRSKALAGWRRGTFVIDTRDGQKEVYGQVRGAWGIEAKGDEYRYRPQLTHLATGYSVAGDCAVSILKELAHRLDTEAPELLAAQTVEEWRAIPQERRADIGHLVASVTRKPGY